MHFVAGRKSSGPPDDPKTPRLQLASIVDANIFPPLARRLVPQAERDLGAANHIQISADRLFEIGKSCSEDHVLIR
jgi:hypothetical protein